MSPFPRKLLCALSLILLGGAFHRVLGDERRIQRIEIHGLKSLEEPIVRLNMTLRQGDVLDAERIASDLAALRATGIFSAVSHRIEAGSRGRAILVIEVEESPVVRSVEVLGATLIPAEEIAALFAPLQGKTPRPEAMKALEAEVVELYRKAGWFACAVAPVDGVVLHGDGRLVVRVVEPVLGRIHLRGLRRVRPVDVRRRLVLPAGRPLSVEAMKRSVRRVGQLGTLRSAVFSTDESAGSTEVVDLSLNMIEESHTGELAYGLRYTSVDRGFATLELTKRNLFGTGKTLTLESEFGGRTTYQGKIATDWFLGIPLGAEGSLFRQKYDREVRDGTEISSAFDERRRGAAFALVKTLPRGLRVQLGLRDEKVSATATDGYALPANLALIGGDPFEAAYDQTTLRLSAARGPYLLPLEDATPRASHVDIDYVGGPLVGPADYLRIRGGRRILLPRGRRTRLALRSEFGSIHLRNGTLPFLESLTLGGSETLRGYDYKEFTGNRLLLANVELRRTLSRRLDGVAFLDWGDCWSDELRAFDPKVGYGLGFRIDLSIFRLRIDAAHGTGRNGTQFTFGVGHLF